MNISKEEKDTFFKKYELGDTFALNYLKQLARSCNADEELLEFTDFVIDLNYYNDLCETERFESIDTYRKHIEGLYFSSKWDLFNMFGITEADFMGR